MGNASQTPTMFCDCKRSLNVTEEASNEEKRMNTNDPDNSQIWERPPRHEDYPDTIAYQEAMRDFLSVQMGLLKEHFDQLRDDFIALENPSQTQADFYKEMEHRYRTIVGLHTSWLRSTNRYLRHWGKKTNH
jgi:hypothetical protein